jgi:hypothetical protein
MGKKKTSIGERFRRFAGDGWIDDAIDRAEEDFENGDFSIGADVLRDTVSIREIRDNTESLGLSLKDTNTLEADRDLKLGRTTSIGMIRVQSKTAPSDGITFIPKCDIEKFSDYDHESDTDEFVPTFVRLLNLTRKDYKNSEIPHIVESVAKAVGCNAYCVSADPNDLDRITHVVFYEDDKEQKIAIPEDF